MPYETKGNAVRVKAGVACRHGQVTLDDGIVGRAIKTKTPAADTPRADRDLIAADELYNSRPRGIAEVPLAGLEAATRESFVYIDPDDNALSLAQAGNNKVAGKVTHLPGEQGTPADKLRIHLDMKA